MSKVSLIDPGDPVVTERACGGWLAVTPYHSPLRIGVVSHSESGVRLAYVKALMHWKALTLAGERQRAEEDGLKR